MSTENQIPVTIPPGSVVVTPSDMYTELRRVSEKVEHLIAVVDPAFKDIRSDVSDHETRLRSVERRIWAIGGAALAGGVGISQALQLLGR